ncbi:MAG: hypothetical protein PGN13_15640 [Patulibacter minatonensis]
MPRHSNATLLRRATCALTALALAAAFAATPASAGVASLPNACLYSYDQEWREVDLGILGTTTAKTAGGAPVAAGGALAPGDRVTLSAAELRSVLPDWIAKFGVEGGWLEQGTQLAVEGWLALDATNTVEGTTAPIHFTTTARTELAYLDNGQVDGDASKVLVDPVALPSTTWTAAGGPVRVGQALGDTLGELPVGRNGSTTTPAGSLAIKVSIPAGGDTFVLTLECLPGTTGGLGANGLVEAVPPLIGSAWAAPAYTGALAPGGALAEPAVDADLPRASGPVRAAVGTEAAVAGNQLRVALTPTQRDAWLGTDPVDHAVTGTVNLAASNAVPATQTVVLTGSLADGADLLQLQLPTTRWTRSIDATAGVRASGPITLTSPGRPDLVLTPRATGPGAFQTVQRPRSSVKNPSDGTGGGTGGGATETPRASTTNPPSLGETGTFRPPPATATSKPKVATVGTASLRTSKGKVKIKLTNPRPSSAKVRLTLKTTRAAKVGGKRKIVTVASATTATLKAGKSVTVSLTLSREARALLQKTAKVGVTLTVSPVGSTTTQAVAQTLTLRR